MPVCDGTALLICRNESLTKELRLSKKEVAMLNLGRKEDKFELESKTTTISNLTGLTRDGFIFSFTVSILLNIPTSCLFRKNQ